MHMHVQLKLDELRGPPTNQLAAVKIGGHSARPTSSIQSLLTSIFIPTPTMLQAHKNNKQIMHAKHNTSVQLDQVQQNNNILPSNTTAKCKHSRMWPCCTSHKKHWSKVPCAYSAEIHYSCCLPRGLNSCRQKCCINAHHTSSREPHEQQRATKPNTHQHTND
jgi:hypothetical protein